MKRFCGALVVAAVAMSGLCLAISSEPVYINGPDSARAFTQRLEKLFDLVQQNGDLFEGDFVSLLESEATKFGKIRAGSDPGKIEITKIYRSLDAAGRKLVGKRTAASSALQDAIRDSLDWIEQQNSLKNITRGW